MGINNLVSGDACAAPGREFAAQNGETNAAWQEKIAYHQRDNAHSEGKQ